MISGIPDPAAAGANCVTMYTEEKTGARLRSMYTKNPTKYECCIIAKVKVNFHPEKFSTAKFMNIAANPVPENRMIASYNRTKIHSVRKTGQRAQRGAEGKI